MQRTTTVITLTRPMQDFERIFANGQKVASSIDISDCTEFWPKGTNSECLIYAGRKIKYSCCYAWAYGVYVITSVWGESGCVYDEPIDYNRLEKEYGKRRKA